MKKFIIALPFILFLASCGIKHTPVGNFTEINEIDFSKDLVRKERNCAYGILWAPPFAGSSASAIEIAKKSDFTKVSAVDYQHDFFILFNRTCTIIYGK